MKTSITQLFGLEHPVAQGPIGGVSVPALAIAVSEAGGMGIMAATWLEPDEVRANVEAVRHATAQPFGVNLVLDEPQDKRLDIALEAGVPVVSLSWGDPAPYLDRVRASGAKSVVTVASAEDARRAVDLGVDALVAQGWEAGGHVLGQVSTFALVPAVVDAAPDTPVFAAGGIVDGRGLAAALALGAGGVWMGTRFVASEEAPAHPAWTGRMLDAAETDTYYGLLFDIGWEGAPHRTLRNGTIDRWLAAGSPPSGQRPGEGDVIAVDPGGGEIVRYASASARANLTGQIDDMSLWCGQGVGTVREILPAREIVLRTVEEAERILQRWADRSAHR